MTTIQTETQKADKTESFILQKDINIFQVDNPEVTLEQCNAAEYPSDQKWFEQKQSVSSHDFYKFYLERSKYKMSKKEWMQFMKSFSTNFFNLLASGFNMVLPYYMGEMRIASIKINGRQVNWEASKSKYKELTGKQWVKGDSLKGCYVYHIGATKKNTFHVKWLMHAANTKFERYWSFHMSSRYQWKRILKMFTEFPSLLHNLSDPKYDTYKQRSQSR